MRALSVLMLSASLALADPPKLDIPGEVKATGDYVTLTPKTDAKAVSYVGLSGVDPFPAELLKDARTFVLPVRGLSAGRYKFLAVGSLNDEHARTPFVVVVGETPPGPTPNPNPNPNPPTPVPDPLGLVKVSRDAAARLTGPNKVGEAKALAGANRGLASAVAAGGVPATPAAVLKAWREANNAAVPDAAAAAAWNVSWGAPVSAALKTLHAAGKLPDKASWTEAFNSIAAGLEG